MGKFEAGLVWLSFYFRTTGWVIQKTLLFCDQFFLDLPNGIELRADGSLLVPSRALSLWAAAALLLIWCKLPADQLKQP